MDHVAESLHIFLVEKEGRIWFDLICLKLYKFERTTWWCLSILESTLQYVKTFVILEKISKKSHGLLEFVSGPPLGGGLDENSGRPWNLIHSPPCRTPCRLFIHEVFFGPLGLHLRVWSELGRSLPFRPMRALRLQWSRALSLVCEVALIREKKKNTSRHSTLTENLVFDLVILET